ncbi:response regulator [Candidatus Peregrinibacteria bacterium]|nr:response regulator [Candidatus Peregrinibacteria bacterium]
MKILLVEDEKNIADFIKEILESEKISVTTADSVEKALKNNYSDDHDVIILDLMLEGKSGDGLVESLRKAHSSIPILVLSALSQISKKVELLNLGADDYMTKPFDAEELIARVNALYRRHLESSSADEVIIDDLKFIRKQNKIIRGGRSEYLTKKEGEVLDLLIKNQGNVVRTEDLLLKVWQAKKGYHSNIVQATIRRLRKKVDSGFDHKFIRNVHGIGYMFVTES